jgi:ribonuclease G
MSSLLLCNVTGRETRVALVENNMVTELFIERMEDQGIVGNIYKGRVSKVLPGMQVAFVDIGLEKAGFLYVSDIYRAQGNGRISFLEPEEDDDNVGEDGVGRPDSVVVSLEDYPRHADNQPIDQLLKEGEEIMVQVSKDPMAPKGARITSYISLPGRYLVYMPKANQVGVSRRIENEDERKRLKETVMSMRKNGSGYIIRTAAEKKDSAELEQDLLFLDKLWASIKENFDAAAAPSVVYEDLKLIPRVIRDLYKKETEIVIDDEEAWRGAHQFCQTYVPSAGEKIQLYSGKEPLFSKYGIELEIERAMDRKVWLKSGGYIVIDQTEALTAIDVNTGKFVGKRNQEETILKTNLEAVQEIVYQLRLRNIGGIIIIDFIDMERQESKDKVYAALDLALKADRSKSNILKISELGLVEMTRKRSRDSLARIQTAVCPYCEGRGRIKSAATILYEMYRAINATAREAKPGATLVLSAAPELAELLMEEPFYIEGMEAGLGVKIVINSDHNMHQEKFQIRTE